MRLALIADSFPPLRTSAAVQLRDLSRELARHGHEVSVLVPSPEQGEPWRIEHTEGVQVMRLRAFRTKDVGYLRRTLAELLMPYAMLHNLRKSPLSEAVWDGVIWYAPSIFLGPIANALKTASSSKAYLIVRDIFPEWALDMGLMRRGPAYGFFKAVAAYQYSVADVIGVQTNGNLQYFTEWTRRTGKRAEVLQNWLAESPGTPCSIAIQHTALVGRKIFVYAGNMGVAQGMDIMLELAERLRARTDIGFLFVGRGSDAPRLAAMAKSRALDNVLFHDEIDPDEIAGLYAQCHVGLIALDPRHKTHNIPGKFLTYMQSGLPVLANINPGNDLAELIEREAVGGVCVTNSAEHLARVAEDLLKEIEDESAFAVRCRALYSRLFCPSAAVHQIVSALTGEVPALSPESVPLHVSQDLQR